MKNINQDIQFVMTSSVANLSRAFCDLLPMVECMVVNIAWYNPLQMHSITLNKNTTPNILILVLTLIILILIRLLY